MGGGFSRLGKKDKVCGTGRRGLSKSKKMPSRPSGKRILRPGLRLPLLMINGKYDGIFPLETAQIPLFKLFGTPEENKHHVILDTDHSVWVKHDIVVKEILEWLDKYLGPVE